MGRKSLLLLLALLVGFCAFSATNAGRGFVDQYEGGAGVMEPEEGKGGYSPSGDSRFLLQDSARVVRTDAGEMKVLMSGGGHRFWRNPMHIGLITMEPNSLFIPQYLDSSLILFIRTGEARIGHIQSDDLVERTLNTGDLYRISSGSAFYIVNSAEGQRLHVVCSIDTSDNYGWQWNGQGFQSYFMEVERILHLYFLDLIKIHCQLHLIAEGDFHQSTFRSDSTSIRFSCTRHLGKIP